MNKIKHIFLSISLITVFVAIFFLTNLIGFYTLLHLSPGKSGVASFWEWVFGFVLASVFLVASIFLARRASKEFYKLWLKMQSSKLFLGICFAMVFIIDFYFICWLHWLGWW